VAGAARARGLGARLGVARAAPAQTTELFRVAGHWLEGERAWVREVCERIDAGHYRFAGEDPGPDHPVEGIWPAAVLTGKSA
jgi:hypothetical protein